MSTAGRKLFVGSLPPGIDDSTLRTEFSKYGVVEDIFVKPNCDPSKQWAFVTMAAPAQAEAAKVASDRILFFPGAERPCDVMVAKNQGMFGQAQEVGPPVMAGTGDYAGQAAWPDPQMQQQQQQQFSDVQPTKIFVGSLPDGITDLAIREEYSKYGAVSDVFVKPNCEPGRQWAFVTLRSAEEANYALQMTNGILQFPGSFRTCEVTMARNQGMFGKDPIMAGPPRLQDPYSQPQVTENVLAPKKIFVGSLPLHISDDMLRAEFSQYGQVTDVHINNKPCDSGRQWAFVTFANAEQASHAKISCDRILIFPGAEKACEVTLARHQGMFGQESIVDGEQAASTAGAPKKIFVGSLPESANDALLRHEFGKYGQVTDVYISTKPCEPGRNWAFVTFATPQMAQFAKDSCDRVLWMPNADRPCEVMLAKNQGKFGQENMAQAPVVVQPAPNKGGGWVVPAIMTPPVKGGHNMPMAGGGVVQPPPPTAPPPEHLTPWRMYKTAAGLPYYHNNITQVTQWECPPELQVPGQNVYQLPVGSPAAAKGYMPY